MAMVDKYVSVTGAGAHDGTSEANAWTLAEAATNAVAGDRVNIKSGGGTYTLAANFAPTNAGTVVKPIHWRGYKTTIGDLSTHTAGSGFAKQNQANLNLDPTDFPIIDGGGSWQSIPSNYSVIEAIKFTAGALNSRTVALTGTVVIAALCYFEHTGNTANGACVEARGTATLFNCHLEQTNTGNQSFACLYCTTTGTRVFNTYMRAKNTQATGAVVNAGTSNILLCRCILIGDSKDGVLCTTTAPQNTLESCIVITPNGNGVAISNVAATTYPTISNTRITDSSRAWNNGNSGTSQRPVLRIGNRTRDNANGDNGSDDWPEWGRITTDTGGPTSDSLDITGYSDFKPVPGSPVIDSGLLATLDIGALQKEVKTVAYASIG